MNNQIQKRQDSYCFDNSKKRHFEIPHGGIVTQREPTRSIKEKFISSRNKLHVQDIIMVITPRIVEKED